MNNRPIDRSKKSNIKCEHCMYCDKVKDYREWYYCILHIKKVDYWNRCKEFKWRENGKLVTPQTVKSLVGENHIMASTGEVTECKFSMMINGDDLEMLLS